MQPYAAFIPEPNRKYQIRPSNEYYVTFEHDLREGSIVNKDRISQGFFEFEAGITLVHGEDGRLPRE
jgi:hypothetical protein